MKNETLMTYKELSSEDALLKKPIFAIQQVQQHSFIVGSTEAKFLEYDRLQRKVISEIPNPSGSINLNCLEKAANFS